MGDAALASLIEDLMTLEASPTLPSLQGFDVGAYCTSLLQRFRNPALKHRTWQIAMDGSQKLPQRLLGTVRDRLAAGAPVDRLALGVAAWMRYVTGVDEKGAPIDVRDPLAPRLRALADDAGRDAPRLAQALLGVREIFGADLPEHPVFREAVIAALASLFERGAAQTLRSFAPRT
jgi:fructuronate reductase